MSDRERVRTTIEVSPAIWLALRRLAEGRALEQGGRPSSSAVVEALVAAESERLERERARAADES